MVMSERKKRIICDIVLVAVLLAVGISALVVFFAIKGRGEPAGDSAVVVVEVGHNRVGEYPLYEDGVYELNGGTNTLTVKDGEAWISEANCPGYQDCVMFGKINGTGVGQIIVCSPNQLHVYIEER